MKKFILLTAFAITAVIYQPAKAQVSINVNIGTPAYYGYNSYYVPARPVVYVDRDVRYHRNDNYYPKRNVVIHRAQPIVRRSYYSNYNRPANRYYNIRNVDYKHHNKSFKSNGRGHGKGKH